MGCWVYERKSYFPYLKYICRVSQWAGHNPCNHSTENIDGQTLIWSGKKINYIHVFKFLKMRTSGFCKLMELTLTFIFLLGYTVMILSFQTDMPGQTVKNQIRLLLIRVYTVCHSLCIVWTHYSMVEPHSSNFRVITTKFLGVRIFRKFTVIYVCGPMWLFLWFVFIFSQPTIFQSYTALAS